MIDPPPTSPRRRKTDPSGADPYADRVYTEADVASMRERWEMVEKERSITAALAGLTGRIDALPSQIREISKSVYLEMRMAETQANNTQKDRVFNRTNTVMAIAMVIIAMVTLYKNVA